jgi:hypothetical protein
MRFTQFRSATNTTGSTGAHRHNLASDRKPIWGIDSPNDGLTATFYWVCGGNARGLRQRERLGAESWHYEGQWDECYDRWEYVDDPNEWPDEVCTEVAKRALLGQESE